MRDEGGEKNGRPFGESRVLAAVDSHKKQDFCLKSLPLGSRQRHQLDTQTHLGYCRNLADVLFLVITEECISDLSEFRDDRLLLHVTLSSLFFSRCPVGELAYDGCSLAAGHDRGTKGKNPLSLLLSGFWVF